MKVTPDTQNGSRIGLYIWFLAKNLKLKKQHLRMYKKLDAPSEVIEHCRGEELEAHNRYYGAKEFFAKEIEK